MKVRMPLPKMVVPAAGKLVVYSPNPGRFVICTLIAWAWQEDCDEPPGQDPNVTYIDGWAWMEMDLEPTSEVQVSVIDAGKPPVRDWLN